MTNLRVFLLVFTAFAWGINAELDLLRPKQVTGDVEGDQNDKCAAQWRPDALVGRCFGVGPFFEMFPEYVDRKVRSARACKKLCCKLGAKCITWQFGGGVNNTDCRLGGPVRYGAEASGVSGWCEPNAPRRWEGFKVNRRDGKCGVAELVPGQCFGLGPEAMSADGQRLTLDGCKEKCCNDANCKVWQALPDRGCFLNSEDAWCDPTVQAYTGQRKCARGFCGDQESVLEAIEYKGKVA